MEAVRRGELAEGDLLPAERELAQQFDVNRQIVREALAALHLAGVVETRTGLGTFIRQPVREDARAQIWALDEEESPIEVLEARMLIEPAATRLAAARLTSHARMRLDELLQAMDHEADKAERGQANRFPDLDIQFHLEVARASGNAVIARYVEALLSFAHQRVWKSIRERAYEGDRSLARAYLSHHRAIFDAFTARNADKASQAMGAHLESARQIWFGESAGALRVD
jgi:DNA-binding FadR family transcriptional regulator